MKVVLENVEKSDKHNTADLMLIAESAEDQEILRQFLELGFSVLGRGTEYASVPLHVGVGNNAGIQCSCK